MVKLGPFELIQPIGRGGMCEVWRGIHRRQHVPVAIKIVLGNQARTQRYARTFREEVRAIAGLQHPSIVQVYDYGQIPDDVATSLQRRLTAGSPYLVMELGDGTLRSYCGHLEWSQLYRILLSLLDALAHAHARGVIHRDLKPGNILFFDQGRTIKLTDFGLAHALGDDADAPSTDEIMGTPAYMAPEQFERRWRDYGPWTDLYTLGCTAFALLTGEPPYGRLDDLQEMMRSHLYRPLPSLPASCDVPPHFEQWLRCLLAKSPTARFQRAADAAWGLMELAQGWRPASSRPLVAAVPEPPLPTRSYPVGLPHSSPELSAMPSPELSAMSSPELLAMSSPELPALSSSELPAITWERESHPQMNRAPTLHGLRRLHQSAPPPSTDGAEPPLTPASPVDDASAVEPTLQFCPQTAPTRATRSPRRSTSAWLAGTSPPTPSWQVLSESPSPLFQRPPLVEDWRRPNDESHTPLLHNVGLGLYGLRAIPWAGREDTRDQLWQTLLQVCRSQRPHLLLLHGPAGCGKSRLARWLCERSHEVGTATSLRVTFGPDNGQEDGFEAALLRELRGMNLDHDKLFDRLYRGEGHRLGLTRDECEAFASWLAAPTFTATSPASPPMTPPSPHDTIQFRPEDLARIMEARATAHTLDPRSSTDTTPVDEHEGNDLPAPPYEDELWMHEDTWMHPLSSSVESEGRGPRFQQPDERYGLLVQWLQRLSQRRPVVLWLDDVHWSQDALCLTQHIVQHANDTPFPLLLLLTARDDMLAQRPEERETFASLLRLPQTTSLSVGPLSPPDHSRLVRTLLGLQGDLALQVETRTEGNPLFAVQLVGDWVQRGLLEPTERGFRLRPGETITIPDSLHQVWKTRIGRLLDNRPAQESMLLELAAVLGQQVNMTEWQAVCQIVGEPLPHSLLEELLEQQLAHRTSPFSDTWRFAHTMLRESLQRQAQEANRLSTHHWVCATMLRRKTGRGIAERLGRHLHLAGKLDAALPALLQGLREREEAGEYRLAQPLLRQWGELLEANHLPSSHPYWGDYWLLQSQLARGLGDYEQAFRMAQRARNDARQYQWERILPLALILLAHSGLRCGHNLDELLQWLLEAEQLGQQQTDASLLAKARWAMGEYLCLLGKWSGAEKNFQQAYDDFASTNDTPGMGRAHYGLATVARQNDRFAQAQHHLEVAQRHFEASHCQRGIADCLLTLGDLYRARGQLDLATDYYRESRRIYQTIGAGDTARCDLNLALVQLYQHHYAQAHQQLTQVLATFTQNGSRLLEGLAHVSLLPCLAHKGNWDAWQHHISLAHYLLRTSNFIDVNLAESAQLAGQLAEQARAWPQALEAYRIALQQWSALERNDRRRPLQAHLLLLEQRIPPRTRHHDTPARGADIFDANGPTFRSAPLPALDTFEKEPLS